MPARRRRVLAFPTNPPVLRAHAEALELLPDDAVGWCILGLADPRVGADPTSAPREVDDLG